MIYFYSDPHFFHENIIKYQERPFGSVDEMNSELVNRYNSIIRREDLVYILGDIFVFKRINKESIDKCNSILNQLNGEKILIRGNHDPMKLFRYLESHFKEIIDKKVITYNTRRLELHHYPIPNTKGTVLHGHDHSNREVVTRGESGVNVNLTCDLHDFYPVSAERVLEYLD